VAGGRGRGGLACSGGERLFTDLGCNTCHRGRGRARTELEGLFGNTVQLQDGRTVVADEAYIRESILNPQAKIVAGYQPLMPTYQGLVSEEGLQLIAYIKSLQAGDQPPQPGAESRTGIAEATDSMEPRRSRAGNEWTRSPRPRRRRARRCRATTT
jgi:cytochrome c oxidase subunit II